MPLMLVYAAGIGIGYGLTFFASTILLLDYFGRGAQPGAVLHRQPDLDHRLGGAVPGRA